MRRTILSPALLPVSLLALGAVALGGCSAFENLGGGKKVSLADLIVLGGCAAIEQAAKAAAGGGR